MTTNYYRLPTPLRYQEMSVERDTNGVTYLYMGSDYVAFTPPEWQTFRQAIWDFKPVGLFAEECPYTFAHTRAWCGNRNCRES